MIILSIDSIGNGDSISNATTLTMISRLSDSNYGSISPDEPPPVNQNRNDICWNRGFNCCLIILVIGIILFLVYKGKYIVIFFTIIMKKITPFFAKKNVFMPRIFSLVVILKIFYFQSS